MALTILIDTNVLLDDLLMREPHAADSRQIVDACRAGTLTGVIAAHSISNMFYILRKVYSVSERRTLLLALCDMFQVAGIDEETIRTALTDEAFPDFEDCLQEKCAIEYGADHLVTWNVKDYSASKLSVLTPPELWKLLDGK